MSCGEWAARAEAFLIGHVALTRPWLVWWSGGVREVVGRDVLLADLVAWLAPAAAGSGRSVLLRGEAGIGKSVLVETLSETLGGEFRVARGWCSSAGAGPYWPWRRIMARSPRICGWLPTTVTFSSPS